MQRKEPISSDHQEPTEKKDAAGEEIKQVNPFQIMGGMMGSMVNVAKEADSKEFKDKMEKDPIGSAFELMFRMFGGMVEGLEKAAKEAEQANNAEQAVAVEPTKVEEKPATTETVNNTPVVPAAESPSVTKLGLYRNTSSPLLTPEPARKPESATSSPALTK